MILLYFIDFLNFHEISSILIDKDVLLELKKFSKDHDRSISKVVTQVVSEFLQKSAVRPAFQNALEEVLLENEEFLKRLAQ